MSKNPDIVWLTDPVTEQDHHRGSINADVVVVEYGDYEDPASARVDQAVQRLEELWGDKLCFVFRHFPKADEHPHAELAAEAAEEAGAEGIFWAMHNQLLTHQDRLDPERLLAFARDLELDPAQFGHKLREHAHHDRIQRDLASGMQSGVETPPTLFINGRRFNGDVTDFDQLQQALESAAGR